MDVMYFCTQKHVVYPSFREGGLDSKGQFDSSMVLGRVVYRCH